MAAPVTLERFDSEGIVSEPKSLDYNRGYNDGISEAKSSAELQLSKAISELTITLNDLTFGYEEARQQVLAKLSPLMAQISEHVVPNALSDTFGMHLSETLNAAIERECSGSFRILVSPENANLLESSELGASLPYDFSPSADLVAGQAIVSSGVATQVLDLSALTNALRDALLGFDQTEWSQMNG